MVKCCVPRCTSRSEHLKKLYKFPTEPERKEQWLKFINRGVHWQPTNHSKICEDHFDDDQFVQLSDGSGGRVLILQSCPTKGTTVELKQQKLEAKSQRGRPLKPKPADVDPLAVEMSDITGALDTRERRSTRRKQTWIKPVETVETPSKAKTSVAPMQKILQGLCRVCAGPMKQIGGMDVFGPAGKLDALEGKIFRFLPIVVSTLDAGMPRHVCNRCVKQLAKFQSFYEATSKADTRLRDMISSKSASGSAKQNTQSIIPSYEEWPSQPSQENRTNQEKCDSNQDEEEDNTITVCISPDSMAVRVRPEDEEDYQSNEMCEEIQKELPEISISKSIRIDKTETFEALDVNEPLFKKARHDDPTTEYLDCQLCDRSFQNFPVLQDHYSRIHSRHLCNICAPVQNYFNSEQTLLTHIRSTHT